MAEVVGIIGSAIAIANSAATLSRALFDVVHTLKNARREIADIAQQLSFVSGSLHLLADVIQSQQKLCKPALFKNTNAIMGEYSKVDAELRKLVESPQSIARLMWYIKRSKVQTLLKRIEAIKTLLTLELTVVQLAREATRLAPASDSANQAKPSPNRFRKLVESTIEANRQVIESAQRENLANNQYRYDRFHAELDVYREGSFDTATWLYHVVFSPQVPDLPRDSKLKTLPYQASVSDESTENAIQRANTPRVPPPPPDKTMIVWGKQTEPSRVVDRLLSTWTTLSDEQITQSSVSPQEDEWRESFLKMIEEAKVEGELTFEQWENENGSSDSNAVLSENDEEIGSLDAMSAHELGDQTSTKAKGAHQFARHIELSDVEMPPLQHGKDHAPRISPKKRNKNDSYRNRRQVERDPWAFDHARDDFQNSTFTSGYPYGSSKNSASANPFTSHNRAGSPEYYPFFAPQNVPHLQNNMNPFRPSVQPIHHPTIASSWHEPYKIPPFVPHPSPPPPPEPSPPPKRASMPNLSPKLPSRATPANQTQQQESEVHDPRFQRIFDLLSAQQEQKAQTKLDRAKSAREDDLKHLLAVQEKDDARIKQLEQLVVQQIDERLKSEAKWKDDKYALDQKLASQTQELKDLAEKEINAARAAEKAARKSLKFAKEEAEKRANEETQAREEEEKRQTDQKSEERMGRYEKLLENAVNELQNAEKKSEQPLRRTYMVDGNRSVEVSEYSSNISRSYSHAMSFPMKFFQEDTSRTRNYGIDRPPRLRVEQDRHNRLGTTAIPLRPSRSLFSESRNSDTASPQQQIILFSPQLDRTSSKISDLQTSLDKMGVDARFEDMDLATVDEGYQGSDFIRSSILWEAPSRGMGSELLETYRQLGWRPSYTRSSDAGHTYYLGSQPIHTFFFRPDYKPQLEPSRTSKNEESESIIIDKALIHEYALLESGFEFHATESGTYFLDGRLQYSDIELLIERSFSMREIYLRRLHRGLEWRKSPADDTTTSDRRKTAWRPPRPKSPLRSPISVAGSRISFSSSHSDEENDDTNSQDEYENAHQVENYREPDSEEDEVPALTTQSTSSLSQSLASWSSKSSNPFRRSMRSGNEDTVKQHPRTTPKSFWDDPIMPSLLD